MNDARRVERPRDDISEVTLNFRYTLFLLALGAAGAVGAQQPRRITFNDAIAIALGQNLAVKQAKNATARYSSGVIPPLPISSMSGSRTARHQLSRAETSIGAVILH